MEESLGNANREVANATQDVKSAGGLDNDMDLNNQYASYPKRNAANASNLS